MMRSPAGFRMAYDEPDTYEEDEDDDLDEDEEDEEEEDGEETWQVGRNENCPVPLTFGG